MAGKIIADTLEHSTAGSVTTDFVVSATPKSYAKVDGTVATAQLDGSFNVSSVTDSDVGRYVLNITNSYSATDDICTSVQSVDANGFEWAVTLTTSTIRYANHDSGYADVDMQGITCGDLA